MSYSFPRPSRPISTNVEIPSDFLTDPPPGSMKCTPINFANSNIPEYANHAAFTIDNVLSIDECTQLIALAESSVPNEIGQSAWQPATLRLAPGVEVPSRPGYRESGRIVWCDQAIMDRIWDRLALAEGLAARLKVVPQGNGKTRQGEWQFRRINDRMSFLRYGKGQYFKPHCDGPYFYETDKTEFQTHYTVQLYLNDSEEHSIDGRGIIGGATAFLSRDKQRRLDVNPKAGSVLIFQHEGLLHEGAEVHGGVKFTMRTDILYEWIPDR